MNRYDYPRPTRFGAITLITLAVLAILWAGTYLSYRDVAREAHTPGSYVHFVESAPAQADAIGGK